MKKQRKFYCDDLEYKLLKEKAGEYFSGKGFLSKFLQKIAKANSLLIIEGKGKFIIQTVK